MSKIQEEKWENKVSEDQLDSDGQELESLDEFDEMLEVRMNKIQNPGLTYDSENKDGGCRVVLNQRLHREPTTRTKRAQKMHSAYCRSMGLGSHTPATGYVKVVEGSGKTHWTSRR